MNKYGIVIHTDSYAGNFEREMTASITGIAGDCGVGDEFEREDADFVALITQEPDESGTHRPCVIYHNPNYYNNGMGGHFKEGEEEKAYEHYKAAILKYREQHPTSSLTLHPTLHKHYAYNSVLIHTNRELTIDEATLVLERARSYSTTIKIEGVQNYSQLTTETVTNFTTL
jgi:hypothetical protein